MSSGKHLSLLTPEIVAKVAAQTRHERFELGYIDRHFQAQKRLLDAAGGIYRG